MDDERVVTDIQQRLGRNKLILSHELALRRFKSPLKETMVQEEGQPTLLLQGKNQITDGFSNCW